MTETSAEECFALMYSAHPSVAVEVAPMLQEAVSLPPIESDCAEPTVMEMAATEDEEVIPERVQFVMDVEVEPSIVMRVEESLISEKVHPLKSISEAVVTSMSVGKAVCAEAVTLTEERVRDPPETEKSGTWSEA